MTSDQIKTFALSLVNADSEDEVAKILKKYGYWDESNWKDVNSSTGNWSTIGSQQSSADTALVEKIINSVDAMLLRECKREGLNPESQQAPSDITAAQKKYFKIYNGKLSSINVNERISLARNIYLIATGKKTRPSFSIVDLGEGQNPEDFKTTFLSLNKSNKNKVQFVQGKFGMGGTGALSFASPEHNFQLIISKKDPQIISALPPKWGITVLRRMPPTDEMRSSVFKYLAPNNEILSLSSKTLPLLPGTHPIAYEKPMEWGSFIKLYEYNIGSRLQSNIRLDLFYRLSLLLPNIALPVTLVERRDYPDPAGKTRDMTIVMAGLSVRLDADRQNNLEEGFPSTGEISAHGQKMNYSIYAFKKARRATYSGSEGIIFSVNGQAQGFLNKSFFERNSVGMSYLSDSILVLVDCSSIEKRRLEDLFMNSRDRLRDGQLKTEIEKQLEEILKNHQGLRELKDKRRRADIEEKLEDAKPLAEVLESIIVKSPSLSALFTQGIRISNPFKVVETGKQEVFTGKKFPTFFKISKDFSKEKPKTIPSNIKRFRVQYETDAFNDYFERDTDPAEKSVLLNGAPIQDYSWNLWNGIATLNVVLPKHIKVGDTLCYTTEVSDVSRAEPFTAEFCVQIGKEYIPSETKGGKRRPPRSEEEGDDSKKPPALALPNAVEVRRKDWESHTFDSKSALRVVNAGGDEGYDFFINMDNIYLQMEIKQSKKDPKIMEAKYKYGMVLLGLALLDYNSKNKDDDAEEGISIADQIRDVSAAVSPILLPMITSLGEMDVEEG